MVLSGNSHAGNQDYAEWIGVPPERVAWIPNAVDPADVPHPTAEQRRQVLRDLGLAQGRPVILGVFRLSEEKRPEMFVDACKLIAQRVPGIRAFIAGCGPMQRETEDAIRRTGLSGRVTLLGQRTDVPVLMSIASLVLLTSRHEGMPNVLLEAQLAGVPVVATRVGGTPDCVADGVTGFLADKDDLHGLADRCAAILSDAELAAEMRERGRELMRAQFGKTRVASLYQQLATGGPAALDLSGRPISEQPHLSEADLG
jgi:glycosyltransferase involved in cell wall biosynthesis